MLAGCGYVPGHKMPPVLSWLYVIKEKVHAVNSVLSLQHGAWDPDIARNKHEAPLKNLTYSYWKSYLIVTDISPTT